MNVEKIIEELNRKFKTSVSEFNNKRQIIFWIDEDAEFADRLDEIKLENAKVVALTGNNNFYVKKLLAVDDPTSNYLVYRPFAYESDEENWLLDVELYSEEFRADLASILMDEMKIPKTPVLRQEVKRFVKFFKSPVSLNKMTMLKVIPTTPTQLQMMIMAVLAGVKDVKPNPIIKALLKAGEQADNNPVYHKFVNYDIHMAFWKMIEQCTGYLETEPDLGKLAKHILLTASTRTLYPEFLKGFKEYISSPHQAYCYDFVSEWIHREDSQDFYKIAEYVEEELKLPQHFMKLKVVDLVETEVFPCIDEVILIKLMTEIKDNIINVEAITQIVEKRRTSVWYNDFKNYYEGILMVAKMQAFYQKHSAGFHTVEPEKIWQEYTTEYYMMDTWYREFHKRYSDSLIHSHEELHDLFTHVKEKVEGFYVTWFLGELGNNWSDACAETLRERGMMIKVSQQTTFYEERIHTSDNKSNSGNKIYVIISDALRYEVGSVLAEQLQRETQAKVELSSMQALFPTITKFGMAALLPHTQISVELKNGRLAVLADGQSTEAPNRDKILKAKNPASVALKYQDIIGMKRADRRALVKGMNVVYIYHDTIDQAGHQDNFDFGICDTAIEEIKNIVRIIANEWGGANIIITADHGFLYTDSPLTEDSKVDKTTESDQDVEIGRRYAIMKKGAQPEYLLPVKFLKGETDYDAFAPRENIRIKMKGGGLNFVHGGISLQEMVVPVIKYHFLRNQSMEYQNNKSKYDTKPVEIGLLSPNRKICNRLFSLNFYQKEAVGGNREAVTYQLYFTDSSGTIISDFEKIIADKTSDNGQERIFRCSFNLKSHEYSNTETYYLVIADENGLQIQREEFQIDLPFTMGGFDF